MDYMQMYLPFKHASKHTGGHGLRPWARFGDAAFVGQWALTFQAAFNSAAGTSHFLVLDEILAAAFDRGDEDLPLAHDLREA